MKPAQASWSDHTCSNVLHLTHLPLWIFSVHDTYAGYRIFDSIWL